MRMWKSGTFCPKVHYTLDTSGSESVELDCCTILRIPGQQVSESDSATLRETGGRDESA
jgi:hypothetical protein